GLLSILGAVLEPMGITPKELADRTSKRNTTKLTSGIFLIAVLISACLVGFAFWKKTEAENRQKELRAKIVELEPVKKVYEENVKYRNLSNEYITFDGMTETQCEQLYKLVCDLETKFPEAVAAISFTGADSTISINMQCDYKMSAAQLIMNMKELPYLKNINIPSMKEVEKTYQMDEGEEDLVEHVVMVWSYTITAKLVDDPNEQFIAK
ncbi:MAG: hypothetical protein IKS85_06440, partial [Lachnospiraceae bacterium]|nr:hypothetical protein [Lachnospiraceae bacterium]